MISVDTWSFCGKTDQVEETTQAMSRFIDTVDTLREVID